MFSWSNLFKLQNCDLNDSMVNWLGVEKESLSADCTYKLQISKPETNSTFQGNTRRTYNLGCKTIK